MNPMDEQREIVGQLAELMIASMPDGATGAECRFELFLGEDGSRSVGTEFHYDHAGIRTSARLHRAPERAKRPVSLVSKLHALMHGHTGGSWNAFRLSIAVDGRIAAKLEYPDGAER